MICLTKKEVFNGYRALLEIEKFINVNEPCFQEDDKVFVWICYAMILSPLMHVLYCFIFK